jgi:isoleucyl-tRNA synthetase
MVDYREDVKVSKQILARAVEAYRKIRNTLRYLLSNLYDFTRTDLLPLERMEEVDRYAVSRYAATATAMAHAYERYDYPTIFQVLNQFATVDLSAFYADVSKDRLYTFASGSTERRSAQTAMYLMADGLVRLLAPILSITADELWRHLPDFKGKEGSVHIAEFPTTESLEQMRDPRLEARWELLLHARSAVNAKLEVLREAKTIGSSLQGRVTIDVADPVAASLLRRYADTLPMFFIVSDVTLGPTAARAPLLADHELDERLKGSTTAEWIVEAAAAAGEKCPRCWRIVPTVSSAPETLGLCSRCVDALAQSQNGVAG